MRIKMLRSLGKNLPVAMADEGEAVKAAMDKDPPHLEGQVREIGDAAAYYLIRNGLAEETDDEITKLPMKTAAQRSHPQGGATPMIATPAQATIPPGGAPASPPPFGGGPPIETPEAPAAGKKKNG